jgi:UDP-N-acetylmuramyl pentapeptide synthase
METVLLPMTLKEIADAVGGSVHDAEPDTVVTEPAQYDPRLLEPWGLFVAFPGQSVDGHDFASRAVAGGAVAVLAGRPVGMPAVVVDDAQAALGVQAEHAPATLELVRRRWAAGDVVPVEGAHALGLQSPARQWEVDGATQDHANAERNGR